MMTAEEAFFRQNGRVYQVVEADQISLRDLVSFPMDAADLLGEPFTWKQYEALSEELAGLEPAEREAHPLASFALAVLIWSSRRAAGDTIRFAECLDSDFEWVEVKQPRDRQPGKRKAAKAATMRKPPGTSGRAAGRPASDTGTTT